MLYDSTKALLREIVSTLETGNVAWDDQNECGKQCLFEMHQMARPLYKGYKTDAPGFKTAVLVPVFDKVTRAIPHAKSMVHAIRRNDQAAALQSAKAALAEM